MKTTRREPAMAMIARNEFVLTAHVLWDTGCAVDVITNIFVAFVQVMKEVTDFSTAIFGFFASDFNAVYNDFHLYNNYWNSHFRMFYVFLYNLGYLIR